RLHHGRARPDSAPTTLFRFRPLLALPRSGKTDARVRDVLVLRRLLTVPDHLGRQPAGGDSLVPSKASRRVGLDRRRADRLSLRSPLPSPSPRGRESKSSDSRVRRGAGGAHAVRRRLLAGAAGLHSGDPIAVEHTFPDPLDGRGRAAGHRRPLARGLFVAIETTAAPTRE